MNGVVFTDAPRAEAVSPNRGDIGCFIGFVTRRKTPLPEPVHRWLRDQAGWRAAGCDPTEAAACLHRTVPLDNFETFDQVFRWESRPVSPHPTQEESAPDSPHPTWLGAAVRSFFAQGGSRCFVVPVGGSRHLPDPTPEIKAIKAALEQLIPGREQPGISPESWRGIETLLGLPEVSFVCFPDLPELVADAPSPIRPLPPLVPGEESFAELSRESAKADDAPPTPVSGPTCSEAGYTRWFQIVNAAGRFLAKHRRDVQLILAVPLPASASRARGNLAEALSPTPVKDTPPIGLAAKLDTTMQSGIASAWVQLVYPWLQTELSPRLPGQWEPPDGTFAGVLARTAAAEGVHRSLGRQPLRLVTRFHPALGGPEAAAPVGQPDSSGTARVALIDRLSLLGDTPSGPRVWSDVTTSLLPEHRPASVNRLTNAILRAARRLGEEVVFDPSGPELWRTLERRLNSLLTQFHRAGALSGERAEEAFTVRCDRTTTSQNDLDQGRVMARVEFSPAHPVGVIQVVLSVRDGTALVAETLS